MSYGHGTGLGLAGRWGFRPVDIAGCILWLRADKGITVTGLGVSTWADQSGQGNDAVQATDADRPAFSPTGGPAGRPAVNFDRANTESMYWPTTTFTDASTSYTIFAALVQRNVATTQQTLLSWIDGAVAQLVSCVSSGASNVGGYDNVAWRHIAAAANGAQILTWQLRDATDDVEVWRNGVTIGTTTWATSIGINDDGGGDLVRLGSNCWNPAGMNVDAALAEVIVYNSVLSAGNLATGHAYLQARYGL